MASPEPLKDLPELDIRPLTGALGCEIIGVDLANLDEPTYAAIYQAFLDYSVVVFRDQELDEESFAAFGKRFGKLEDEPFLPNRTETPGIYYFRGAGGQKKLSTQNLGWHMDHSYQKNPSLGAMLYAVNVPKAGGDTRLAAMRKKFPQVEHPLICSHPETAKKMLFINKAWTTAIKGLHPKESKAILEMLKEHSLQDRFQCRVRWYNKSLLLWDNRCLQHSPNVDYEDPRWMLRLALHSDWVPGTEQA